NGTVPEDVVGLPAPAPNPLYRSPEAKCDRTTYEVSSGHTCVKRQYGKSTERAQNNRAHLERTPRLHSPAVREQHGAQRAGRKSAYEAIDLIRPKPSLLQ